MTGFVSKTHILGRFPELVLNEDFQNWIRLYDGNTWHETDIDAKNNLVFVLQSSNRLSIFAALIHRDDTQIAEGEIYHKVLETRSIDLTASDNHLLSAVKTVKKRTGVDNDDILAIRPVVDFSGKTNEVVWEIETKQLKNVQTFHVDSPGKMHKRKEKRVLIPTDLETVSNNLTLENLNNDWLAENECHHLTAWKPMAQQIVGGAATPSQKAFAIYNYVRQHMKYDSTIINIEHFTWSDTLIANICNWRGICDEWSVIQITLLRCVGVPAVLKFLSWQFGSNPDAHACVEWQDNTVWRHMDALYNAFDNRSIYRQRGAANIKVMDASSPIDSRFTGVIPNWGVMDYPGDQKFYPYGDFIISPSYPGEFRPGYSY